MPTLTKLFTPILIIFAIGLCMSNFYAYSFDSKIGADIVSRVLPAVAPFHGMGVPYKDYWEITPPGHLIILAVWTRIFGEGLVSYKLLHLLIQVGIAGLIIVIFKRVFSGIPYLILTATALLFVVSTRLVTYLIPAENVGLVFSLWGLYTLLTIKNYKKSLFLSSFLFLAAGQMKDPFSASYLAVLPFLIFLAIQSRKKMMIGLGYSLLGIGLVLAIIVGYLALLQVIPDYQLVLDQKNTSFKIFEIDRLYDRLWLFLQRSKDIFIYWQYPMLFPIIVWLVVTLTTKIKLGKYSGSATEGPQRKFSMEFRFQGDEKTLSKFIVLFYAIGSVIGFAAGTNLGSHYLIQMVLPVVILLGLCWEGSINNLEKLSHKGLRKYLLIGVVSLVFLAFLAPKKEYFQDYPRAGLNPRNIFNALVYANAYQDLTLEKKIQSGVSANECIEVVYGWGVGTNYYYSLRQPCSKYFLANWVTKKVNGEKYLQEIVQRPPKAIYYSIGGADIDVERFEREVFNYPEVLKQCYVADGEVKDLYWAKNDNSNLSECIKRAAQPLPEKI